MDGRKCDEDKYHKRLPTDEQVRDIEKVGLAGSSLAPVARVILILPASMDSQGASSQSQAFNDDLEK